jgi:hypothetical protein
MGLEFLIILYLRDNLNKFGIHIFNSDYFILLIYNLHLNYLYKEIKDENHRNKKMEYLEMKI